MGGAGSLSSPAYNLRHEILTKKVYAVHGMSVLTGDHFLSVLAGRVSEETLE